MAKTIKRETKHGAQLTLLAPIFALTENGKTLATFDIGTLPGVSQQRMFDHCWSKLGDAMAKPVGTPTAEKIAAAVGVWEILMSGEWTAKRESLTPEERAAQLRERVIAAWISRKPGERNAARFAEVERLAIANQKKLGNTLTPESFVTAMSKHPEIILAMAKLAGTGNSIAVDDFV
jgi:hypothetical protein